MKSFKESADCSRGFLNRRKEEHFSLRERESYTCLLHCFLLYFFLLFFLFYSLLKMRETSAVSSDVSHILHCVHLGMGTPCAHWPTSWLGGCIQSRTLQKLTHFVAAAQHTLSSLGVWFRLQMFPLFSVQEIMQHAHTLIYPNLPCCVPVSSLCTPLLVSGKQGKPVLNSYLILVLFHW